MSKFAKIHNDYSDIPNNNDKLFKALIEAIEGSKNDDIIEMLVNAVKLIAERKAPEIAIKQDNEATLKAFETLCLSLDVIMKSNADNYIKMARSIEGIKPEINFSPVIENKKEETSYKFDIKRNSANLITEVVAKPI